MPFLSDNIAGHLFLGFIWFYHIAGRLLATIPCVILQPLPRANQLGRLLGKPTRNPGTKKY